MKFRIGNGIDAHQLQTNIALIIGGVSIPFSKGSKGHSDGDVLFHAVIDAVLGALALGDIGKHFPSDNPKWKGVNSRLFLEHTYKLMAEKGYSVENIDATIIIQDPRLSSYIEKMRENIASILSISIDSVSVKATTTDHLGFTGSGEGIAAMAIALLTETDES